VIEEIVHFCAPSKWGAVFFDQVDQWMESRRYRTHEYETDAAAYCAHRGLHVDIHFSHVEMETDRRTLACTFCWKNEVEREFFFRAIGDENFMPLKVQPSDSAYVSPTGSVDFARTSYSSPEDRHAFGA
jgi:hypothetical protein